MAGQTIAPGLSAFEKINASGQIGHREFLNCRRFPAILADWPVNMAPARVKLEVSGNPIGAAFALDRQGISNCRPDRYNMVKDANNLERD